MLIPIKKKLQTNQFHWSGLENWPGLHRRQFNTDREWGEHTRGHKESATTFVCDKEIVPEEKFQKMNCTAKISPCPAQEKDALNKSQCKEDAKILKISLL